METLDLAEFLQEANLRTYWAQLRTATKQRVINQFDIFPDSPVEYPRIFEALLREYGPYCVAAAVARPGLSVVALMEEV